MQKKKIVEFVNLRLLAKFGCNWNFKKLEKIFLGPNFAAKNTKKFLDSLEAIWIEMIVLVFIFMCYFVV